MPQQALRRHDDERLAQRAHHLPAQHVKHLRRSRRHAHLHVVLGAELQEPLQARRGMLGSLTLVAMRQEQRDARQAAPLGFAGTDELIDDDLRAVAEVAELTLPNGQAVRLGGREAVLETHDRLFGQHRIGHGERRLVGRQVLKRNIAAARGLIVQHRVAVEESAPAAVLAGQTHRIPLLHQACVCQVLGRAPVEREIAVHHSFA